MSFSRAQQPAWQAMKRAAWEAHCRAENIAPVPRKEDRDWYEQELFFGTGQTSTTELNAGRDYDRAMAHFEGLAGAGIRWQMRVHSGDAKRLLHELDVACPGHGLDEDYLRAMAQRMRGSAVPPVLAELSREECILILGEAKRFVRRKVKREMAFVAAETGEGDPF